MQSNMFIVIEKVFNFIGCEQSDFTNDRLLCKLAKIKIGLI